MIQENAAELFLSVRDNLMTFGRFHGLPPHTIRARSADVLDQFGLAAEANRKVMDLSGGFRRRVQVAKVFMVDTPVVFLDEFSTGMDPLLKRSVMTRLREEASRGRTIVLTTQILSEAEELCDDILILNAGRQAARGDVNAMRSSCCRQGCMTSPSRSTVCPRGSKQKSVRTAPCVSGSVTTRWW